MAELNNYAGYDPSVDDDLTETEKKSVQTLPNGNLVCKHDGGGYMGLYGNKDEYIWLLLEPWETEIIDKLLEEKL